LKLRGVPVQFACPPGSHLENWCRERGLLTIPVHVRNSGDVGAVARLAKTIHTEAIDIVHAHSRRDYMIAVLGVALAQQRAHRRVRLILHAHMIRPLGSPLSLSGRFFAWGADAIVAVSGAVRDHILAKHRFSPGFVQHIPNGVDLGEFATPGSSEQLEQRITARKEWAIPSDALVIGMIGRLDAKGQANLLAVMPRLASQYPTLRIVFIGSEGLPGEKARLIAQGEAGGFRDLMHFTGPREDIPSLLPALDILVHLPIDEAFGLALTEAMAAGIPTVATDIGGCREVVQNGLTGILTTPGDSESVFQALQFLLDKELGAERRAEMGQQGRVVVGNHFSRDLQVYRLLTLYRELCPLTPTP